MFIDLGTGSGCIAIGLKKKFPGATVIGIDLMKEALKVATENAFLNKVDVTFKEQDLLQTEALANYLLTHTNLTNSKVIVVSNPPYISVKEAAAMHKNVITYEPHTALFAPEHEPLLYYKAIAKIYHTLASYIDSVWLEVNSEFASETEQIFTPYSEATNSFVLNDLHGKKRFVTVQRNK
jgi:release factor glutamine methyltransferase